jgi:glucokinase
LRYLGIDVGGTYARAAVVSAEGEILASCKTALAARDPSGVIDAICLAADEALGASGPVVGAGVGIAGQLEGESGVVAVAPNLGWRAVPFGSLLGARLGRPVRVVNDLSAAAWGEFRAGAGRGTRDIFVVFVGSGVGSAIVAGGRIVTGAQGFAGEFGHVKVEPGGRPCGCGERGCVEAYVGGHNLLAQMQELLSSERPTQLRELVEQPGAILSPALLETAALAGDQSAKEIYDRAVAHLGLAVANQVTVLNPARLIIGGGVLSRCPGMRQSIRDAVGTWSSVVSRRQLVIAEAELGDDSGIIGAALLAAEAPAA